MNDATEDLDTNQVSISQYADDIGTWATGETVAKTRNLVQKMVCDPQPPKIATRDFHEMFPPQSRNGEYHIQSNYSVMTFKAVFLGITFDQRMTWDAQFQKNHDLQSGPTND